MKNIQIAQIFNDIADILELKDENPFRIRAYRKAAQNLEGLTEDLELLAQKNKLTRIPGIGKDLASKILEFLDKGKIKDYEQLKKKTPHILIDMMTIPTIGPKTAKLIYDRFKIKSIQDLENLARQHKISGLPGLKEKTEENILKGIAFKKRSAERTPLGIAYPFGSSIVVQLKKLPWVKQISTAGSLRRMKETIRDIDILVTSENLTKVMDFFIKMPDVSEVLAHGETKSSIRTKEGIEMDLRVVKPESFGAALLYFTGSKSHNIHLRKLAQQAGLKVNEYGIFREKTNKRLAGAKEEDIYKTLRLDYIPPELREDTGEIEAAQKGSLPGLIELKDIKSDLHIHTEWSDGSLSIEEMANAAKKRGYEYIVITDHSKSLPVAGGLKEKRLLEQAEKIDKINKKFTDFRILKGAEVDILNDGSMDFPDRILSQLDFVIGAIHSGFKQSADVLTERITNAMKNKYVNLITHPTGRLMGVRDAYQVNLEEVFKVAVDTNTILEINAYPQRLDLNDIYSRRAKAVGVRLAIATDSHTADQLNNMLFGIATARRAWLEKKDIINTLSLERFLKAIKK